MSDVLKHNRKGKTSSRATEFFDRIREEVGRLPSVKAVDAVFSKLEEIPPDKLRLLTHQAIEEGRPGYQKQLLVDMANLRDDGQKWFWHKYGPMYLSVVADAEWMQLRDEVRVIW